jgi:carbon-monoxide dehydrogenase medium subunit
VSLVALDAEAEVVLNGVRGWRPIRELYLGPGQSLLDPTRDLLVRFRIRGCAAREATAFNRIMRPQGVALPILGCAVWVRLDDSAQIFQAVRVCIAPLGPTPARFEAVEQALVGQPATPDMIRQVAEQAMEAAHPRTSKYRATADYRREMIGVLLERTLESAIQRAR